MKKTVVLRNHHTCDSASWTDLALSRRSHQTPSYYRLPSSRPLAGSAVISFPLASKLPTTSIPSYTPSLRLPSTSSLEVPMTVHIPRIMEIRHPDDAVGQCISPPNTPCNVDLLAGL